MREKGLQKWYNKTDANDVLASLRPNQNLLNRSKFMAQTSLPDNPTILKCSVEGCTVKHYARMYCVRHYVRFMKHGVHPTLHPIRLQFWEKAAVTANPDKCWVWQKALNMWGYGTIGSNPQKLHSAHRMAYFLFYGVHPGELQVLHRCDNPPCINPHHLFLGTNADNVKDKMAKGRHRAGKKPHGRANHPVGERNPAAKLSSAQVREIRRRYANGEISTALAKEFNVGRCAVWRIVKRMTYEDV